MCEEFRCKVLGRAWIMSVLSIEWMLSKRTLFVAIVFGFL